MRTVNVEKIEELTERLSLQANTVIRKDIKLALMECGRKLQSYLRKLSKAKRQKARLNIFIKYAGELAESLATLTEKDEAKIRKDIMELIQTKVKGVKIE